MKKETHTVRNLLLERYHALDTKGRKLTAQEDIEYGILEAQLDIDGFDDNFKGYLTAFKQSIDSIQTILKAMLEEIALREKHTMLFLVLETEYARMLAYNPRAEVSHPIMDFVGENFRDNVLGMLWGMGTPSGDNEVVLGIIEDFWKFQEAQKI